MSFGHFTADLPDVDEARAPRNMFEWTETAMYNTVVVAMLECNPSILIPRLFSHVYYRCTSNVGVGMYAILAQGGPIGGLSGQFLGSRHSTREAHTFPDVF